MVLQVGLANETVIVIGSVTAKVAGAIVTCAWLIMDINSKAKLSKIDFFIVLSLNYNWGLFWTKRG
jgi:hypothetical protein